MFSSRTAASLSPNRLSRLLDAKRRAGVPVIDLTESNPTRCGFDYPGEAILAALAHPRALRYEPAPRGLPEARRAVARYYADRGVAVHPEQVHVTASTSEAYAFLFTLLADPGDAVLAPAPSYPLLEHLAALASVRLVPYPLVFDGACWRLDADALAAAARDPGARALVLVAPNNPTGSFLTRDELAAVAAHCAERDLGLIADEVFADYAYRPDPSRAGTLAGGLHAACRGAYPAGRPVPLAFALNGLSKVAGLPQLKLGWVAVSGPADRLAAAQERLDLVADTFLSVGTPAQAGLAELLALAPEVQRQIRARVLGNRARLEALLGGAPACRLLPAEGGWYAVLEVPRHGSEESLALALLEEDDVLAHPGYFFDFPREAFLVLSLLPEGTRFEEAARRVVRRASGGA